MRLGACLVCFFVLWARVDLVTASQWSWVWVEVGLPTNGANKGTADVEIRNGKLRATLKDENRAVDDFLVTGTVKNTKAVLTINPPNSDAGKMFLSTGKHVKYRLPDPNTFMEVIWAVDPAYGHYLVLTRTGP